MTAEFDKLVAGGPGPVGDYCRRIKADGSSSTPMTQQQLKESGAGFWADMARQGGTVIGGGGPLGLLDSLTWHAGTNTNLSIAGGFARATGPDSANNPRIMKGPFVLPAGTHVFTGKVYERTAATNMFFRVSTNADLSSGFEIYQNSVGGTGLTLDLTGLSFVTGSSTPAAYVGIVPVIGSNNEYSEIDDLFNLT